MSNDIRPSRQIGEENVEGSARHLVLDHDHVVNLALGDSTPSIKDLTRFRANGNGTITDFKHGADGQRIHVIGDGSTVIAHNSTIKRTLERNDTLELDKTYTFTREIVGGVGIWYEDIDRFGVEARKDSGATVGPRSRLNFLEGTGIDIAVSDDPGSDEIDVQITATGGVAPAPHASTHQDGGTDEISVLGLSGLLADAQTPLAHKTSHENGGSDEISVVGLSGELADAQKVNVHKNGTLVSTRKNVNFIEGTNVTLTVADDPGDDEADVTITASGGDPADDTEVWMPLTTVVAGVPELVWDGDDSLIPTLVPI